MILGIDAGGTHTRFVLMDNLGNIVHESIKDSLHFMKVGFDGIEKSLNAYKQEMNELGYEADKFDVAIGMAGYGNDPKIREGIANSVYAVFPNAILYNDAQFALISALNGDDGVFVISGTGSIALRKDGEEFTRSGGFGYLIDDGGSGFWIGKKIMEAFVYQVDNRHPKTELYDEMMNVLELDDPYQVIQKVVSNQGDYRNFIANIAQATSHLDDEVLNKIYVEAGLKLAELANSFVVKEKTSISIGGSVLLKNKIVRDTFINNLNDKYVYVSPKHPVEYAAYLLYKG